MNSEIKELIDQYIKEFNNQEIVKKFFVLQNLIENSYEINLLRENLKKSQKDLALSINNKELHKIKLQEYLEAKNCLENNPYVVNYNLLQEEIYHEIVILQEKLNIEL